MSAAGVPIESLDKDQLKTVRPVKNHAQTIFNAHEFVNIKKT